MERNGGEARDNEGSGRAQSNEHSGIDSCKQVSYATVREELAKRDSY
jgi:hypothetical protein